MELARPGLFPGAGVDPTAEQPGFVDATVAAWKTQWAPQLYQYLVEQVQNPEEPGYNPWTDIEDEYLPYAGNLITARSRGEMAARKSRIDYNNRQRQIIAESTWGEGLWSLVPDMAASMLDPTTYIPMPIAKGMGFIKGATRWGAGNAAIVAGTEGTRFVTDPTMTTEEYVTTIGAAVILGGALGGVAGTFGRTMGSRTGLQRAMDNFIADANEMEGIGGFARKLTQSELGMKLVNVAEVGDASGRAAGVVTRDEFVRLKEASDGNMYYFDDRVGRWIREVDRGASVDELMDVPDYIQTELGPMRTEQVDVLEYKEVPLREEYRVKTESGATLREGIENATFRNSDEWVTFNLLEAVWRKLTPEADDATIQAKALEELQSSRVAPTPMGWAAKMLDKVNFSPVKKMISVFPEDSEAGSFALQLGGDYGWAVSGNYFGYRTPPSLHIQNTKHAGKFWQLRSEIDKHWMRYVSGGASEGREVLGLNLNAQASRLMPNAEGRPTYIDFAEMVGRAVFLPDDFEVNGHTVVPEAREAAKAVRKMLAEYEREARDLNVFKNIQNIDRNITKQKGRIAERKEAAVKAILGERRFAQYRTAVRYVDGEGNSTVFIGADMAEVRAEMDTRLGVELARAYLDEIDPSNVGYLRRVTRMADIPDERMLFGSYVLGPDGMREFPKGYKAFKYGSDREGANDPDVQAFIKETEIALWNEMESNPADWDPEEVAAYDAGDFETFSRLRGYTEEQIAQYKKFHELATIVHNRYRDPDDPTVTSLAEEINFDLVAHVEAEQNRLSPQEPDWDAITVEAQDVARMRNLGYLKQSEDQALAYLRELRQLHKQWFGSGDRVPSLVLAGSEADIMTGGYYNFIDNVIAVNWSAWEKRMSFTLDDNQIKAIYENPDNAVGVFHSIREKMTGTYVHETVHFMRAKGYISNEEWNKLRRQALDEGWIEKYKIERRYDDSYTAQVSAERKDMDELDVMGVVQDAMLEEAIAEAMKDLALDVPRGENRDALTALKAKVMNFIADMHRMITGAKKNFKIESVEDLFTALAEGRMKGRKVDDPSRGAFDIAIQGGDPFEIAFKDVIDDDAGFQSVDDLLAEAVRTSTGARRRFAERRLDSLREEEESLAELVEIQRQLKENPNRFNNGENGIENYFPRIYDTFAIAANREQFTRLATEYFGGGEAARERAEEWVAAILGEGADDPRMASVSGFRSLNSRKVNWANSYKIIDPELGEIKLTDFIETNVFKVMEEYTRRMGMKIEAARMFGDPTLRTTLADKRKAMEAQYVEPLINSNADDAAINRAMDQVNGYMNHAQNTADAVMGTLRRSDPWRWDNRSARALKDWSQLAMMGRVALTSIPEIMRPFMVAGAKTAWGAIFETATNGFEQLKYNKKWTRAMAGETNELARDNFNARFAEMQRGEAGGQGGTKFERMLHDAVPWLYKLNGLTAMTTFLKDWTMTAAQHAVMIDAQEVAAAIRAGTGVPAKTARRLAALGIGQREALLLAKMPVERGKSGLILPAVQNWKGTEGVQAQKLLLDAIIAESRRAIVTPSIADKSLLFSGVVTRSDGERIGESDWASVPLQFMGYAVAANQKVLMSMVQGRDRSVAMGIFTMMIAAYFSNYLKTPENAWNQKDFDERLVDAYESSGLGALVFGDLNLMLERYSNNTIGLRPAFGMDPKFGRQGVDSPIDIAGPGPGMIYDLSRPFWDTEMNSTQAAQTVRRAVPLQNFPLWAGFTRNLATDIGEAFKE